MKEYSIFEEHPVKLFVVWIILDGIATIIPTILLFEKLLCIKEGWYDKQYNVTSIVFVALYFASQLIISIIYLWEERDDMTIRTLFLRFPSYLLNVNMQMMMLFKDSNLDVDLEIEALFIWIPKCIVSVPLSILLMVYKGEQKLQVETSHSLNLFKTYE